jgi:hypothetical protein
MGVVIQFVYADWIARYPEFAPSGVQIVSPTTAQLYFNEATMYCRNDGGGPVSNSVSQTVLLYMVTAHIAQLNASLNNQSSPQTVGRISDATEGSVSVSLEMDVPPGSAQWFNQTKYGAAFWAASAPYRTMRYMRGPVRVFEPYRNM